MSTPPEYPHQVPLTEDELKADHGIAGLYGGFSAELLRLALIGIGAYGFLLAEQLLDPRTVGPGVRLLLSAALVMLMLAACLALVHRYLVAECMACQAAALRTWKGRDAQEDPVAWAKWQARYDRERRDWGHSLVWSGRAIAACAMALGAGIVLLGLGLMGGLLP